MGKEKFKLAYITSMVTGGLAGFNYRELNEMSKIGVSVDLFVTKYEEGPYMPPAGIRLHRAFPSKIIGSQLIYFFKSPIRYIKLLNEGISTRTVADFFIANVWSDVMKQNSCEWIHCHWGDHKLYIGYYCHKITGIPLSVTLHGYDLYMNPNWEMLERSLRSCAQIITISEYNRRLLIEKYGELGERVKVIRLSADFLENLDGEKRKVRVLIVGGWMKRKGYDILIEALAKLNRKDIHLWVVGYKGPVDVPGLVKEYHLEDRVTIFGQVPDEVLQLLYMYCDIFCMPSRFAEDGVGEGLPVSLMEAMSYGKAIVSTYHTGIPELVPDILVDENSVDQLAEGIEKLADDPELREQKGVRNREIVRTDFSNENVLQLVEAFKI